VDMKRKRIPLNPYLRRDEKKKGKKGFRGLFLLREWAGLTEKGGSIIRGIRGVKIKVGFISIKMVFEGEGR